ncbi:hypothetical protein M758_9G120800 [Ceratodon purpureus]|nr:hypothetical protein M758_9G120800 [Ceratodon purpureus]
MEVVVPTWVVVVVVVVQLISLVCFRKESKRVVVQLVSFVWFKRESNKAVVLHIRENENDESRSLGRVAYHNDRASHLGGVRAFLESFKENPIVPWPFDFWDTKLSTRIATAVESSNDLEMHGHVVTVIRSQSMTGKESMATVTDPPTIELPLISSSPRLGPAGRAPFSTPYERQDVQEKSSCPESKGKIFLSHSGAQKPFVEQLCKELERHNRYPFFDQRDDSLPKGKKFAPLIFDAAKECKVAVVVLSREYLTSTWPMLELVEFVRAKRSENKSLELLPLFYKASVADLSEESIKNEWRPRWMDLVRPSRDRDRDDIADEWAAAVRELRRVNGLTVEQLGKSEARYREEIVKHITKLVPSDILHDTSGISGCDRICKRIMPELPQSVLESEIIGRLEDARDIAKAQLVCKDWWNAGKRIRYHRIVCLDMYHEWARDRMDGSYSSLGSRDRSLLPGALDMGLTSDGEGPSGTLSSIQGGRFQKPFYFKQLVVKNLEPKSDIVDLFIGVEPKLQCKVVPQDERRRTDFWLVDPWFLRQWLPMMGSTLQHLCIVDYGQQALWRRSSIIKILSKCCKLLKTLDLRNMFIDTNDCDEMNLMASLTLRCVKVVGEALQHINDKMPWLQRLALLGVFGAEGGLLVFPNMKVLCLGLSTPAKEVVMELPKLEKLQLKMQCPTKLIINALNLKYVAFNLEVLEPSKVDLRSMSGLDELLYGATSFITLSDLVGKNRPHLKKIFLDIPCMAFGEDGRFLGVLKDIALQLPSFSNLHQCEKLNVLSIGPGLWHSMETQVQVLSLEQRWPCILQTLILHMIPHDMEAAISVLGLLLRASVTSLTIFIHTSSPVTRELMIPRIEEVARRQNIVLQILSWTKKLDFSCFSFSFS